MGSSGYHDSSLAKAIWGALWPKLVQVGAVLFCVLWVSAIIYIFGGSKAVIVWWGIVALYILSCVVLYIIHRRG